MARTMGVLRTLPGNRERSPDLALLEGSARWRLGPGLLPSFPCERGRDAGRGGDFGGRGVGAQRETVRRGRGIAAVRDRGDSGNRLIIAVRGGGWRWCWPAVLIARGRGSGWAKRGEVRRSGELVFVCPRAGGHPPPSSCLLIKGADQDPVVLGLFI
jgi:hypothetical protein